MTSKQNPEPEWAQHQDLAERLKKDKTKLKDELPKGQGTFKAIRTQGKKHGSDGGEIR